MPGNLDIELQTAPNIARNRADLRQQFVIWFMLACMIIAVLLYIFTPMNVVGSVSLGICFVAIVVMIRSLFDRRKRSTEPSEIDQTQLPKVNELRSKDKTPS